MLSARRQGVIAECVFAANSRGGDIGVVNSRH
jgi:hypothetical protein